MDWQNLQSNTLLNLKEDYLTLWWRGPLSHMLCKSMDWFLYDNGLRHERVKQFYEQLPFFPYMLSFTTMWCHILKSFGRLITCKISERNGEFLEWPMYCLKHLSNFLIRDHNRSYIIPYFTQFMIQTKTWPRYNITTSASKATCIWSLVCDLEYLTTNFLLCKQSSTDLVLHRVTCT